LYLELYDVASEAVKHGASGSANYQPTSSIVCRLSFPLLQRPRCKTGVGAKNWDKPKWHGVRQTTAFGPDFCSAFIGTGMSEAQMSEAKIARIVAISFGTLWIVMLGLQMMSEM
jgi:hypothetical protein